MSKANLASGVAGAVFGVGLAVAGMTRPEKVVGFLDLTGAWDPSLAFVMVGAILVHFVMFRVVTRRASPLFDAKFHIPTRKDIDARLLLGAALFGVGWGLGGFCPGPGLTSLASGGAGPAVFVVGMTAGMLLFQLTQARSAKVAPPSPSPREARVP